MGGQKSLILRRSEDDGWIRSAPEVVGVSCLTYGFVGAVNMRLFGQVNLSNQLLHDINASCCLNEIYI